MRGKGQTCIRIFDRKTQEEEEEEEEEEVID
jgi:hypothetical protein